MKRVIALFLAVLLLLGTAACGKTTQETASGETTENAGTETEAAGSAEETAAGAENELGEPQLTGTFELQIFVGGYGNTCWEYAIEEFQKLNPDLEIIAQLGTNVNAQMKNRWAKDSPPDFVLLDGTGLPTDTWMREGKLMDLADFYQTATVYGTQTPISQQIKEGLVYPYADTEAIYQMPVLLQTFGVWYDETLFTENGWQMPTNYQELTSFCQSANAAGVKPLIYSGQNSNYALWGFLMPAIAASAIESGDLDFYYRVSNASDETVWSDPRVKDVLTKFAALADAGYFELSALSMNHITSQMAWLNHTGALIPNGLWLENEMSDSIPDGFKMRFYPSVMQDEDQTPCIIFDAASIAVAQNAKNPEAAKAFIRFLYTDEMAKAFAEMASVPSATVTDMSDANISETQKQVIAMLNSEDVNTIAMRGSSFGIVDGTINDVVNKLVTGESTVDDAIAELEQATLKKKNG